MNNTYCEPLLLPFIRCIGFASLFFFSVRPPWFKERNSEMAKFTHVYSSNNWCRLNDHSKTPEFPVCLITWSCTQTFQTKKKGKTKISLQRINTPFPTELELNTNKCNFAVHACLPARQFVFIRDARGGGVGFHRGCLHFIVPLLLNGPR